MAPPCIRILLVEDNPPDVRWFELVLEEGGIQSELAVARSGKAGWLQLCEACLGSALPDVIFLDLNLPVLDGTELLRRIKNDSRLDEIPVCILTGSLVERESLIEEFGLPYEAYILKPLQSATLHSALNCFAGLRRFLPGPNLSGEATAAG